MCTDKNRTKSGDLLRVEIAIIKILATAVARRDHDLVDRIVLALRRRRQSKTPTEPN